MRARTCCLDARDGLGCSCQITASWTPPRPRTPAAAGTAPWQSPSRHRRIPLPLQLVLGALLAAAFLTAIDEGRAYLCDLHEGQNADYCTAYPPNEETP
jgi:hypothetical protein